MASNLVNITAYDVYNRMIELNFPEEMARLFQTEMKDGLYSYIFAAENSIVKSQNTMLIMGLIKLVASYSNPYHSKFDDDFKNMPFKFMCEPWPQSMCDVLASEVDPSCAKIMKETVLEYEQTTSSSSLSQSAKTSKPMALKEITNLQSRSQSTNSNPESCNDVQMPTVYEPSGVKVFICNEMVDLPRFSVTVENSLHIEDECFQILPKACLELVEFLWQMNIDVRTSSDYKQLSRAILFKYEVLEGIISRYIVKGLLAGFPNPPKNSQDHVTKLLQKTFSSLRNSKKRQAKKFLGQLRF